MKLKNKNVLVYGMSQSGEWAVKLLNKHKANVFVYDDDSSIFKTKNFVNCFLINCLDEDIIIQFDFIVVSPSIEKDNQYLVMARKNKIKIYSELEFAAQFCKNLIAITGTNGKTTTVQLVELLLKQKYKAIACGNIGYPLSRAVLNNKNHIKVCEVSSFMLENADTFCPHAASVTNVSPDHLIRHKTMQEYSNLKRSIYKNLTSTDYAVVNLDEKIHPLTECLTVTYSLNHVADIYIKDGYIYLHQNQIVAVNELKIKGNHNLCNVMCAIGFAYIYKIPPQKMREALISFTPEHFRIEKLTSVNGIHFYNDSKSTNVASTLASVETIKGAIILLLGGSKKGLDYSELFSKLSKRVKQVVVYGEIADDLITANNNSFPIKKCKDLSAAFDFAVSVAIDNDNVLLSPATASYDQFSSYIARGNLFNSKVEEYASKAK